MRGGLESSSTSFPFFDVPFLLAVFKPVLPVLAVLASLLAPASAGGGSEVSFVSVFSFADEVDLAFADFGGGRAALCFSSRARMACLEAG